MSHHRGHFRDLKIFWEEDGGVTIIAYSNLVLPLGEAFEVATKTIPAAAVRSDTIVVLTALDVLNDLESPARHALTEAVAKHLK